MPCGRSQSDIYASVEVDGPGVYIMKFAPMQHRGKNKKMEAREKNDFLVYFWAKNGHFQKKLGF